jgi:oligopeptidase B
MFLMPPQPEKKPQTHTEHGIERVDEYYYLNNKEDQQVLAHLTSENEYFGKQMDHTSTLKGQLYDEMLGRIQETDASAPVHRNGYWYYSRTVDGLPYTIYCRKKESLDAQEEIYLDVNTLAEGKEYYNVQTLAVSPDHRYVAWLEDIDGAERFTLRVVDLHNGVELPETITALKWSLAWASDSQTVFFVRGDQAQRPYKICRWRITEPAETEEEVYHEPDERFFLGVSTTRDRAWVVLSAQSKQTSEIHVINAHRPQEAPRMVLPRAHAVEYHLTHRHGTFYLRTNAENSTNFKVVCLPADGSSQEIVEWVAHDPETMITSVDTFHGHIVLHERSGGLPQLRIVDMETNETHHVHMPEAVYELGDDHNPEFKSTNFRFSFSSPVTPRTIYAYNMANRGLKTLKIQPVLGGYTADNYETRRLWATGHDGAKIPLTICCRKGLDLTKAHPTYLRGYGSYGFSYPVGFLSHAVSLLERGVVVAIAHIRGGAEMGRGWYDDGKFFNKINTFKDFISSAEHLIEHGYTAPDRLCISGGSAGGLLIGAVLNERPELFCAAMALVPFVDVATTMSDDTLPLTVTEYEEWGDPNKKDVFEYILSYSPYDQVKKQQYPTLYVTAGLNDPRVGYWEPAKWVCRLRDRKIDENPVLFKIHMGAGHSGASGRYGYLDDVSWQYAFILDQLNRS